MLASLQLSFQNYCEQIPAMSMRQVVRSSLFSFTASLILVNCTTTIDKVNLFRPVLAAGTAALATAVHALAVPLFNYIFGGSEFKWYRELMTSCVALTAAHVLINSATPFKVNLINTISPRDCFVILPSSMVNFLILGCQAAQAAWNRINSVHLQTAVTQNYGIDYTSTPIYLTA